MQVNMERMVMYHISRRYLVIRAWLKYVRDENGESKETNGQIIGLLIR